MKKLKLLTMALGAAALALALTACGNGAGQDSAKVTLCLDWTPNTNHTGIYVAQQQGYFAEAGLEVEIVQPPENGSAAMCAAGQAQFAIEAQDTLAPAFARAEPLGVTAVAALVQHNTSGILSRAGEGLDTPKGLEGKAYATWNNPTELAMIQHVVEAAGGDYSKVNLLPTTIDDEPGALAEHLTDAVWIYYGWGGIKAEVAGLDFDYFAFKDLEPVFDYYTPVLIANDQYLQDQPDQAKAFVAAVAKGYQYAIENPQEAAAMLIAGDDTGSLRDAEEMVQLSQAWLADQYVAEAAQWGYIDPARWDAFYAWLSEKHLVEQELPAGTGFSNDYLPAQ